MALIPVLIFVHLLTLVRISTTTTTTGQKPQKICLGTEYGVNHFSDSEQRFYLYMQRYMNCTIINGNLEIVYFEKKTSQRNSDLFFLQDIQEVTGYVLIYQNSITNLHLNNLRIIRGTSLINCTNLNHVGKCSLYVSGNYHPKAGGLKQLELTSLTEILNGDVVIVSNRDLCFANSINWTDIFFRNTSRTVIANNSNSGCNECHESCEFNGRRYCWGEGPDMCQQVTKLICASQCDHRCYGSNHKECCHKECAAGCTGPYDTDCLACQHFDNDGQCVPLCPLEEIYNSITFRYDKIPGGKFAYGPICVKSCPVQFSTEGGACVKQCSHGKEEVNGSCVNCSPCRKACPGVSEYGVTTSDMDKYSDCVIIQGSLIFTQNSFGTDTYLKEKPLTVELLKRFETVEEIMGSLQVQMMSGVVSDLSFLKNLKIIRGFNIMSDWSSFSIVQTDLLSLGLNSLRHIYDGHIKVMLNPNLCYIKSLNWTHLLHDPVRQRMKITGNKPDCESLGLVCSPQCSNHGCWGPNNTQCISCKALTFEGQCIESCSSVPLAYQEDNSTCKKCHSECAISCSGEGPENCTACLHVQDNTTCVGSCPAFKYTTPNKTCEPCHINCDGYNCTGPSSKLGPDGCVSCRQPIFADPKDKQKVTGCSDPFLPCPDGYYSIALSEFSKGHPLYQQSGCKQCHSQCITCQSNSLDPDQCKCRHYQQEDKCVSSCSDGYFPEVPPGSGGSAKNEKHVNASGKAHLLARSVVPKKGVENTARCISCDVSCLSCYGPSASECYECKNYLIYLDENDPEKGFNCTINCPELAPFKVTKEINGTKLTVCVVDDGGETSFRIKLAMGLTFGIVALIAIIVIPVVLVTFKMAKNKSKVMIAAANLLEGKTEEVEMSGIKPNVAKLNTISEKDLRLGEKIGSGAFGSVFMGIWSPPKANCRIYVAIKVAHKNMAENSANELAEVEIMASVQDDYCVRILGACLTSRLMLITQLMPYGCMLDFLQKNKDNIGSGVLLNWAVQIARGMSYLEQKRIIHRDLAARNVLVQNDNHVRITDFGLSKYLEVGRESYKSEGGKLPIKWLALESLQNKVFSSKSDVWSYGITLWEMFTFGQRPYENVPAGSMLDFLEKGDRLPQPSICTIDVYMVMIKCWLVDADSRPSFQNLVDLLVVMAKDPTRFLVIEDDSKKVLETMKPEEMLRQVSVIDDEKPVRNVEEYLQILYDKNEMVRKAKMSSSSSLDDEPRPAMLNGAVRNGSFKHTKSPRLGGLPTNRQQQRPDVLPMSPLKKTGTHDLSISSSPNPKGLCSPEAIGNRKGRGSIRSRRYMPDPCEKTKHDHSCSHLHSPTSDESVRFLNGTVRLESGEPSLSLDDGDDYLIPEKTSNDYLEQQQQAFSNLEYFERPLISANHSTSPSHGNIRGLTGDNDSVLYANGHAGNNSRPMISLARQESDFNNDVFDDGKASVLLPLISDTSMNNNKDYYNNFSPPAESKNRNFSISRV